jgi:hypothetical protein
VITPPPIRRSGAEGARRLLSFLAARLAEEATAALSAPDDAAVAPEGLPDPERRLREVVAKRTLLQDWFDGPPDGDRSRSGTRPVPDAVIARLVGEYSGHPRFDPAWIRFGAWAGPTAG